MSLRVRVRVTPRSSRARVEAGEGMLHAWVTAPAEEGRANDALVALVAEALDLRRSEVGIVAGARSREKTLQLPDRAAERLRVLTARGRSRRRGAHFTHPRI